MSTLTEMPQPRHFIVDNDEILKRLIQRQRRLGTYSINDKSLSELYETDLGEKVFGNCSFRGRLQGNVFTGSVFDDCNFDGTIRDNDFTEADLIGGRLSGEFINNGTRGMFLRHVDIANARFASEPPAIVYHSNTRPLVTHNTTGRIIFCSGVENSLIRPEQVATFRRITMQTTDATDLEFLGRMYFDGENKKLGLISLSHAVFTGSDGTSTLWPNFIYSITNDSRNLREQISTDFFEEMALDVDRLQDDNRIRVLSPASYQIANSLYLRPARPLDVRYLRNNTEKESNLYTPSKG